MFYFVLKTEALFVTRMGPHVLQSVDKWNTMRVNALVTPGNCKLLLLHDGRHADENIRVFMTDASDLYLKVRYCSFVPSASSATCFCFPH